MKMSADQATFIATLDQIHDGTAEIIEKLAITIPWNQLIKIVIQALTTYVPSMGPFAAYLQQIVDIIFPPTPAPASGGRG